MSVHMDMYACMHALLTVLTVHRGQVMNAEMMSNVVDVEFIYEGSRYSLKVSRLQPTGQEFPLPFPPPTMTYKGLILCRHAGTCVGR